MAHFAQIDENNKVINVIVVANTDCGDLAFPESEPVGQAFIASLGIEGVWKQTSINNNFRKRYAGIGAMYISSDDIFTHPQPYNSWILDSNNEWQAPVSKPNTDGFWIWDEQNQQWVR